MVLKILWKFHWTNFVSTEILLIFGTKLDHYLTKIKIFKFVGITKNNLIPANIYLFKVDNRNTRKRGEIFSKLTIKTPGKRQDNFFQCWYCWLWTSKWIFEFVNKSILITFLEKMKICRSGFSNSLHKV